MAAKEQVWNIVVNDMPYKITYQGNKVSVNNGDGIKLNKLKKEGSFLDVKYILPISGSEVAINIRKSEPTLTINNKIWDTGEEYVPLKMPGWGWIFIVLYIINFVALIGGALGGAISGGLAWLSALIAADKEKSTGVRVLICTAIWLVTTVVEFFLMLIIAGALYS